jgi:diacylglycerol O-acyltransferase / wax synthase
MRSHLSPLDAVFLELEEDDPALQLHFSWAAIFDPLPNGERPSVERLRDQVRRRLVGNAALRRRLSTPAVQGETMPIWLPDPDCDVGLQVRSARLPGPGGEAELLAWIGDYAAQRLDRSRPLWEATLLDGLEGGAWAIVGKIHQCMVDGVGGPYIVASLLDFQPDTEVDMAALGAMIEAMGSEVDEGVLWQVRGVVGDELSGGVDAGLQPGTVAAVVSRSRERFEAFRAELPPPPAISLNGPTGADRRVATVEMTLEKAEAVSQGLGGRTDDVVLAATAGGLRRLFASRREEVERVRVAVPVSMRRARESFAFGNDVAPLFVDLPLAEPDPVRRFRQIAAATAELRSGGSPDTEALLEAADAPAPLVQCAYARLAFSSGLFNLTAASIPTTPFPLYALGAQLRRGIPLGSIFSGHNLGVAAIVYDKSVHFGLIADAAAVPDLEVLRNGIEEAVTELAMVAV